MFQPRNRKGPGNKPGHFLVLPEKPVPKVKNVFQQAAGERYNQAAAYANSDDEQAAPTRARRPVQQQQQQQEGGVIRFTPIRVFFQVLIVGGLLLRGAYIHSIAGVREKTDKLANQIFRMNEEYSYGQILMFGDSITQGAWMDNNGTGAALQHHYQRKLDVLNRGFSGYNTEWALQLAPALFANTNNLKLATIWFGANDAVLSFRAQHVPLERFRKNLAVMLKLIPNDIPVLMISPPPFEPTMRREDVDSRFPEQELELDRTIERTADFAHAVGEVAADARRIMKRPIGFVDLHGVMEDMVKDDREKGLRVLLRDGLHLTGEGYKVATGLILEAIAENFPKLQAEVMESHFPTWLEMKARMKAQAARQQPMRYSPPPLQGMPGYQQQPFRGRTEL